MTKMLEKMGEFFDSRLDGYEEHQLESIASAREFYRFTAGRLPRMTGARILDLGCGTGLELEEFFLRCPSAKVTGVDLAPGMLDALKRKFSDKDITLLLGSYFDVPFGEGVFDAAVSVESLHHFTQAEKIPLYRKLRAALRPGGYFILTDYFALSDEEEKRHRRELARIRKEQGLPDGEFYHYDTPLTAAHEKEALLAAGFSSAETLGRWGATYTLKAVMSKNISNGQYENRRIKSRSGGRNAGRRKMLKLTDISEENWLEAASLTVAEEQKGFLAPAVGIIARGYVYRNCGGRVYAIENDGVIVGLALVREFTEEPLGYDLQQFMIDRRFQGRGYGSAALGLILDELRKERRYDHVEVCVKKEDAAAVRLYEKHGFADSGYIDEDVPDSLNMICRL